MLAFFSSKSQFIKLNKPKPCYSFYSAKHLGIVRNRWIYSKSSVIIFPFIKGNRDQKWYTKEMWKCFLSILLFLFIQGLCIIFLFPLFNHNFSVIYKHDVDYAFFERLKVLLPKITKPYREWQMSKNTGNRKMKNFKPFKELSSFHKYFLKSVLLIDVSYYCSRRFCQKILSMATMIRNDQNYWFWAIFLLITPENNLS